MELEAEVLERGEFGERLLRFVPVDDFFSALDRVGHMPLPPYIVAMTPTRIAIAIRLFFRTSLVLSPTNRRPAFHAGNPWRPCG